MEVVVWSVDLSKLVMGADLSEVLSIEDYSMDIIYKFVICGWTYQPTVTCLPGFFGSDKIMASL